MEESVTYQAIVEKGQIEERQEVLLQFGSGKFGAPEHMVSMAIQGIRDLSRLRQLSDRVHDVSSWTELLAALPR